jgi:hypothetical protein
MPRELAIYGRNKSSTANWSNLGTITELLGSDRPSITEINTYLTSLKYFNSTDGFREKEGSNVVTEVNNQKVLNSFTVNSSSAFDCYAIIITRIYGDGVTEDPAGYTEKKDTCFCEMELFSDGSQPGAAQTPR